MKVSKVLAKASAVGSSLFLASATYAQTDYIGELSVGVQRDLTTWIGGVINLAIGLAALVSVIVLIASGYLYITAAGDESKVEKATKSLTYAIVGLVICFIAVILVQFVLTNVLA